jgi:hypothetical protein
MERFEALLGADISTLSRFMVLAENVMAAI